MKYKITMYIPHLNMTVDMPNNNGMRLFEACEFADIYKRRSPNNVFTVVNEENGDIEYQV